MLSRVADSLYWMGRYLERAENVTRLLQVTEDLTTELQGLDAELAESKWRDLRAIFPGPPSAARPPDPKAPPAWSHLFALFKDPANPHSVVFSLHKARENARSVREALTMEVFLNLNETYRALEGLAARDLRDLPAVRSALWATHKGILGIIGAIDHTLTRDQGWLFLKLGESVERTLRTAIIMRIKLPSLLDRPPTLDLELQYTRWRGLLRGVSSLENYRQVQDARLEPDHVVRFLLFHPDAPRSLRHGTGAIHDYLTRIAGTNGLTPPARVVGKLLARLAYETDEVVDAGDVMALLDHVLGELAKAHDAIAASYFRT
jgi:uncharacterized alpha-E superfamily protein